MSRKDDRDKAHKVPASPKRGAIPSPRSDIDKAKPYVPSDDDEDASGSRSEPGSDPARGPAGRGERHKEGG